MVEWRWWKHLNCFSLVAAIPYISVTHGEVCLPGLWLRPVCEQMRGHGAWRGTHIEALVCKHAPSSAWDTVPGLFVQEVRHSGSVCATTPFLLLLFLLLLPLVFLSCFLFLFFSSLLFFSLPSSPPPCSVSVW